MATSFDALKKSRSNSMAKLSKQLEDMSSKGYSNPDEGKYWQPTVDGEGNGFAIIRFLDSPEGEDIPFVQYWNHGFKGPTGKWYIENSLTTIGQPDPVSEFNNKLWNSSTDDKGPERSQVRDQKRKLLYVSNILVVKDSGNPENEGKVFLYKYGKKIFDKWNELVIPEFEGDESINAFDLWAGADFRLKIRKVAGYRNYDKSDFAAPSPIANTDEEIEAIWKKCHSLQAVIAPDQFKSYEELKKKLHFVLGLDGGDTSDNLAANADEDDTSELDMSKVSKTQDEPEKKTAKSSMESNNADDDDDDLSFFNNLAKD